MKYLKKFNEKEITGEIHNTQIKEICEMIIPDQVSVLLQHSITNI